MINFLLISPKGNAQKNYPVIFMVNTVVENLIPYVFFILVSDCILFPNAYILCTNHSFCLLLYSAACNSEALIQKNICLCGRTLKKCMIVLQIWSHIFKLCPKCFHPPLYTHVVLMLVTLPICILYKPYQLFYYQCNTKTVSHVIQAQHIYVMNNHSIW